MLFFPHCFCWVTNLPIITNATIQKTKEEKPFDVYIINPQKLNAKNTGQQKIYTLNQSFI